MAFETRPESTGRGRGRPIGSDSAETRAAILRCAREVINERGYEAATFQAIAERAGLSRPTMHYYFHTREEIYDSLVREASSIVKDCVDEARCEQTLLRQLSTFVAAASRLGFAEPSMMKFIIVARMEFHRSPILRHGDGPVVSQMQTFYTSIVEDAIARREIPVETDAAAIANMLLAMFLGMGFYAGFISDGAEPVMIAKQLYKLMTLGLLAGPKSDASAVAGVESLVDGVDGHETVDVMLVRETPDSSLTQQP